MLPDKRFCPSFWRQKYIILNLEVCKYAKNSLCERRVSCLKRKHAIDDKCKNTSLRDIRRKHVKNYSDKNCVL